MHHWQRDAQAPEHRQGGRGGLFYVAYYADNGRIDGYAVYRATGDGVLIVNELMAATNAANLALWRFCFDIDLVRRTEAVKRPVDDPLPWALADPPPPATLHTRRPVAADCGRRRRPAPAPLCGKRPPDPGSARRNVPLERRPL